PGRLHPPDLHSFPTRRSSDLQAIAAASAEDQARIAYDEALSIARATPWLEKAAKATESTFFLEHPKSGAKFRAISSDGGAQLGKDRKSTRLNSSHVKISYAVF